MLNNRDSNIRSKNYQGNHFNLHFDINVFKSLCFTSTTLFRVIILQLNVKYNSQALSLKKLCILVDSREYSSKVWYTRVFITHVDDIYSSKQIVIYDLPICYSRPHIFEIYIISTTNCNLTVVIMYFKYYNNNDK